MIKPEVQFETDDVRPHYFKPYSNVNDEKWKEILEKQEDDLFIYRIRGQIMSRVMKECDRIHKQRKEVEFLVDCAHEAWKRVIYLNFQPRQATVESYKDDPRWAPDIQPQPCQVDSWALNRVKFRKPELEQKIHSKVSLSSEQEGYPSTTEDWTSSIATDYSGDMSKVTKHSSKYSSKVVSKVSTKTTLLEGLESASSILEELPHDTSLEASAKTPTSVFSLLKSCTKTNLPNIYHICDSKKPKEVPSLGTDTLDSEEKPNGDADGVGGSRNVVKAALPCFNLLPKILRKSGVSRKSQVVFPGMSTILRKRSKQTDRKVVLEDKPIIFTERKVSYYERN